MKNIAFSLLLFTSSIPAAAQISVRISQDLSGTYRSQGEVPATGTPRSLDESTSTSAGQSVRLEVATSGRFVAGLGADVTLGHSLEGHEGSFSTRSAYGILGYRAPLPFRPALTLRGGPSQLSGDEVYEDRYYTGVGYSGSRERVPVQFPTGFYWGADLGGTWRRYSAGLFLTSIHATRRYRENAESQSQVNRLIDIETVIARYGVTLGVSF